MSTILLNDYEDEFEQGEWEQRDDRTVLSYVEHVNAEAMAEIQARTPWLKIDHSETADTSYLANHCEVCGALQGDWFLSKPGCVFFPEDEESARRLTVMSIDKPIDVRASPAWSSWHDWLEL